MLYTHLYHSAACSQCVLTPQTHVALLPSLPDSHTQISPHPALPPSLQPPPSPSVCPALWTEGCNLCLERQLLCPGQLPGGSWVDILPLPLCNRAIGYNIQTFKSIGLLEHSKTVQQSIIVTQNTKLYVFAKSR